MKIYISGKITGNPEYKKQFAEAEFELKVRGYETINPARLSDFMPASTTYSEYMRICFLLVEMCDAMFMIGDWRDSLGAKTEFAYARALDKKVYEKYDAIKADEEAQKKEKEEAARKWYAEYCSKEHNQKVATLFNLLASIADADDDD